MQPSPLSSTRSNRSIAQLVLAHELLQPPEEVDRTLLLRVLHARPQEADLRVERVDAAAARGRARTGSVRSSRWSRARPCAGVLADGRVRSAAWPARRSASAASSREMFPAMSPCDLGSCAGVGGGPRASACTPRAGQPRARRRVDRARPRAREAPAVARLGELVRARVRDVPRHARLRARRRRRARACATARALAVAAAARRRRARRRRPVALAEGPRAHGRRHVVSPRLSRATRDDEVQGARARLDAGERTRRCAGDYRFLKSPWLWLDQQLDA